MRFASHRDIARAVERGVRKAGLPVAYSAGFSPHPKISYAGGAPTGTASEAEYLELVADQPRASPMMFGDRLDVALPDGIDVIEVAEAAGSRLGAVHAARGLRVGGRSARGTRPMQPARPCGVPGRADSSRSSV